MAEMHLFTLDRTIWRVRGGTPCKEQASGQLAPLKSVETYTFSVLFLLICWHSSRCLPRWFLHDLQACLMPLTHFLRKITTPWHWWQDTVWPTRDALILTVVTVCITRIDLVCICSVKMNISEAHSNYEFMRSLRLAEWLYPVELNDLEETT